MLCRSQFVVVFFVLSVFFARGRIVGNCRMKGSWQICSGYNVRVFYICSDLRNISKTSALNCYKIFVSVSLKHIAF